MTNKSTKKALLLSVLSMLLCVAMLVGTTFAWFTDSVTSGKNTITAGNLDVELEYSKTPDVEASWKTVEGATDLLDPNALWEPGHAEVVYLRVRNLGTLALKYQFSMNIFKETVGKSVLGNDIHLSDYLMYGVVDYTAKFADRDAAIAAVEDDAVALSGYSKAGDLLATEGSVADIDTIALVVYMPTTVGNEANYRGETVPSIELGVELKATQLVAEEDFFGNDYDEDAVYADHFVTDAAGLAEALAEGGIIALMNDMSLTDAPITIADDTVINLNGNKLSGVATNASASKLITVPAGKTLTLTNGVVEFAATTPDLDWDLGFPGYANNTINCSGKLIIDGATVINKTPAGGASYAVDCYPGADLIINDGVVDGNGKTAIRMFANSATVPTSVTINGGTVIGSRAIWVQLPSSNAAVAPTANLTVNGGKLVATNTTNYLAIYTYSYGNSFDKTSITLNGGEYFGDVALGGGEKNGAHIISIDEANCKFYGDVYSYNTNDGLADINANANGAVATDDTALDEAIQDGAETVFLPSGNYIIPDSAQGKELTIIGTGDTVIASQDDGAAEGDCDYSFDGSTVTFENVTITTSTTYFPGYARMKGIYNNCTINGVWTLYDNSEFNNCTFNVSGDVYNVWTWGAAVATFNGCTFNNDGKAILVYGGGNTKLTVDGCTFNDNGGLTSKKAAIEVGAGYGSSFDLTINDTVVNGYEINDEGINTGTTLWGNKNSMGTDKLNVVVDGVDVY